MKTTVDHVRERACEVNLIRTGARISNLSAAPIRGNNLFLWFEETRKSVLHFHQEQSLNTVQSQPTGPPTPRYYNCMRSVIVHERPAQIASTGRTDTTGQALPVDPGTANNVGLQRRGNLHARERTPSGLGHPHELKAGEFTHAAASSELTYIGGAFDFSKKKLHVLEIPPEVEK